MHRLLPLTLLALVLAVSASAQPRVQGAPLAPASAFQSDAKTELAPVAPRLATDEPKAERPAAPARRAHETKGVGLDVSTAPAALGGVSVSFSGTLADRPANYDRPDCNPDNPTDPSTECALSREDVRWEVHPLTVTAAGTYTITADWNGFDGYLILYADDFVRNTYDAIVATDDDFNGTAQSQIVVDLQPGRYELVTAEFDADQTEGAYTGTIVGPGGVITVVTEALSSGIYAGSTDEGVADRPANCPPNPTAPLTECELREGDHPYASRSFLVFQDALVHVRSVQDADAVVAVYAGGFDPENPLDNLVAYDDDDYSSLSSEVAFEAVAGEVDTNNATAIGYYVVVTYRFDASGSSTFDNEIRGAVRSDGGSTTVLSSAFADLAAAEITADTPTMLRVFCSVPYPADPQADCSAGSERGYQAFTFTPSESGFVDLYSTQQFDGNLLLYQGAFSAGDPLANLVGQNDDGSFGVGTSNVSVNAQAGETYTVVLQQWGATSFGRGVVSGFAVDGTFAFGAAVSDEAGPAAEALAFAPAVPNPATSAARVTLSVPQAGAVRLSVFDALGREVAVLADGTLAAGAHAFSVDAAALAPGLYVLRATTASGAATQRLTVAR